MGFKKSRNQEKPYIMTQTEYRVRDFIFARIKESGMDKIPIKQIDIAMALGVHTSAVSKAIRRLVTLGYIKVESVKHTVKLYQINKAQEEDGK